MSNFKCNRCSCKEEVQVKTEYISLSKCGHCGKTFNEKWLKPKPKNDLIFQL